MNIIYSMKKALSLFLFTCIGFAGYAQVLGQYDFNSGSCGSQMVTTAPANGAFSTITNGAGILSCSVGAGVNTITPNTTGKTPNWPVSLTSNTCYKEFSITPTAGYQLSVSTITINAMRGIGGPKSLSVSYKPVGGSWSTPVLLTSSLGLSVSSYTAALNFSLGTGVGVLVRIYGHVPAGTTGTTDKQLITDYIAVNGQIVVPEPTIQPTISVVTKTSTSLTLSFTGGDGSHRLVLAKEGAPIVVTPTDLTSYTASSTFGSGSYIGSLASVVYNSTGSTVTVTGLSPFTQYFFSVFEFNNDGSLNSENYLTTSPGTTNSYTGRSVYSWSGGATGDWTLGTNWTPNRNILNNTDSLVFNSPSSVMITNFTDESVSGISINNTYLSITGASPATLSITNGSGISSFYISSSSTLSLGTDISLYFDYLTSNTIDGNLVLTDASNIITGYYGDVYINGSVSLVHPNGFYGTSGTEAFDGNNLTNIVLGANSTINYTGVAQTITTANPTPYANLTLSGSGTKTPDGDLLVNNLTLSGSSVLTMGANNLSVAGNWTSYSASAFTEAGTTVLFNGASSQTLATTGGEIFEGMTLNNSSLTLSSALRVNGLMTLTAGTVTSGGNLTLNMATGQIDGSGSGSISGNMQVERNFTGGKTHYIASPLAAVTAADIADEYVVVVGAKSRLLDLNCSTGKFFGVYDMSTPLTQGSSFSMFFPTTGTPTGGANTVTFTGTYNHAATSYSASCGSNASVKDFLAGNPYPSNLNLAGLSGSGTTGNYYVFNSSAFDVYSSVTGIGTGAAATGYVAPMQGFQVETNGAGGSASLSIPSSARDISQSTTYARVASTNSLIRLTASNGTAKDETVVFFTNAATNGFDLGYDATKMQNTGTNTPNLYTLADTTRLIINSLAPLVDSIDIPLNLTTTTTSNYTLTFTNKNDFDASNTVLLISPDGSKHNLTQNPTVTIATNPSTPYILRVGTDIQTVTTGTTNSTAANTLKAYMNNDLLIVSMNQNMQQVDVYDMTGNKVSTGNTQTNSYSTNLPVKTGIYIVKVLSENAIYTTKIVVK